MTDREMKALKAAVERLELQNKAILNMLSDVSKTQQLSRQEMNFEEVYWKSFEKAFARANEFPKQVLGMQPVEMSFLPVDQQKVLYAVHQATLKTISAVTGQERLKNHSFLD